MVHIKRALLSCSDKSGLVEFAKQLKALGVELVASGGTAAVLAKEGLPVKSVESFAGMEEQLDGRVKTLHPKIHAGILARRDNAQHQAAVGNEGLIDLVVVNLYPFEQTIQKPGVAEKEAIEQIDIGGVALLRAAAKNYEHVAVVCRPEQYARVAGALTMGRGELPLDLARELALSAFSITSEYDAHIANFFAANKTKPAKSASAGDAFPEMLSLDLRKHQSLRYGENPHQAASWYVPAEPTWGLATLKQIQGKSLSYNNLLDIDAAVRCVIEFSDPCCAVVKHGSHCGLACAADIQSAYQRAHACDPESAFGGIVGLNRPIDAGLAYALTETFLEVIVAPSVQSDALGVFAKKPNLRVLSAALPEKMKHAYEWRQLMGSWLIQEPDVHLFERSTLKGVTQLEPTASQWEDLQFAWKGVKHVKSNGIVIVSEKATVGIGQGQPSRVGSVALAIQKAGARSQGAVAASDGFFPFPDGVELLTKAGVKAIIQPGGSIRDPEVIKAADAAGVPMVLTGMRHFKH